MTPKREYDYLLKTYQAKPVDCYRIMSKILNRMKNGNKHWWFAYEFSDIHYKAGARLSDLVNYYSDLVEVVDFKNRLKLYRLRTKKLPKWAVDN